MGCSALHIAASRGFLDICLLLLSKVENINIESKRGWTALMFAAKAGHTNIVKALLHFSSKTSNPKKQLKIDLVNKANCTALILASYSGHAEIVKLLLKGGADYKTRDKFGMSAHIWAEKKKFTEIAETLKEHGSSLSMKDKLQIMM